MGKKLHFDKAAEKEATDIGAKFMHSSDVVGDMSRAYGRDLSSVRIHTDESAARGAAERGVDAFSTGKDVFFGRGAFDRNDPASRGLLAHELSHSMQQGVGGEGGAMAQSAPMGAAQGGLLDWFRSKFGKKKKPEPEPELNISGPLSIEKNTSEESIAYMKAMEPLLRKERINNISTPAARIGKGGGADTAAAFSAALNSKRKDDTRTYLQASDDAFASGGRNQALVDMGIRTSADAPAQADMNMRGDIYNGLFQDYADLVYGAQESGVDTTAMLSDEKVESTFVKTGDKRMEKLAYASGSGFDALNSKAFDMFASYVLSDESVEYLDNFSQGISPAKVFGGKSSGLTGASGFALQTLVNTVGGNVSDAAKDDRLNASSRRVAVNMGRTIGSLPKMASVPEENIPESLRPLRARYIQLQEELDRKLMERRAK